VQCPDDKHEEHKEVERPHVKHVTRKRNMLATSSRTGKAAPRPVRRTKA